MGSYWMSSWKVEIFVEHLQFLYLGCVSAFSSFTHFKVLQRSRRRKSGNYVCREAAEEQHPEDVTWEENHALAAAGTRMGVAALLGDQALKVKTIDYFADENKASLTSNKMNDEEWMTSHYSLVIFADLKINSNQSFFPINRS